MSSLFYLPKVVSTPGAKLYFYQTDTSTPQAVYTDEDLQVAHSQPVEADANGVFAPIYLDPTLPHYRVTLRTSADVLVYTVDDVPSNQNVQQSMRLESTNPFLILYDTDGSPNKRKFRIRANGDAFEVHLANDAESVFTPILRFVDGVLYSNETEVAVTTTGSFEVDLYGVSEDVSGTVYYRKINNIVSLWTTALIAGTSNALTMMLSGLPESLRPSTTIDVPCLVVDDGNYPLAAIAAVGDSADIVIYVGRTDSTADFLQYQSGFTASGQKGIGAGWTITYPIT
jgi:hypothetical protein